MLPFVSSGRRALFLHLHPLISLSRAKAFVALAQFPLLHSSFSLYSPLPKQARLSVKTSAKSDGIARFVRSIPREQKYLVGKVKSDDLTLQSAFYLAKFGVRNLQREGILIFDKNKLPVPTAFPNAESKFKPMKCSLQFVTTPTADTDGTTLSLTFDNRRYLIGQVAEGTQRASVQIGNKFTKTQNIFLTGPTSWNNIGGMMGLVLTVSDMVIGQKKQLIQTAIAKADRKSQKLTIDQATKELDPKKYSLDIYGSRNLMHAIATCRRFIFRKGVPLNVIECTERKLRTDEAGKPVPTWFDDNVMVWAMVTVPERGDAPSPVGSADSRLSDSSSSSRKRNADEMEDDTAERYDQIRKAVVSDMFSSNWKLDALTECDLKDVNGPAKIFVKDPISNQLTVYTGPVPWKHNNVPDIRVHVRRPWPAALVEYLPPTAPSKESTSYIFKSYPTRGKFLPRRAIELGIQPGVLFTELTKGQSVVNKAGETVTPEMVMEPQIPGSAIAVLDIASADYISPLLGREEWTTEEVSGNLSTIVWILGPGVLNHPEIEAFMAARPSVKHVISSSDIAKNRISMDSSYVSTMRLKKLDPPRFSDFHFETADADTGAEVPVLATIPNSVRADRNLEVQVQPRMGVTRRAFYYDVPENIYADIPEEVITLVKEADEKLAVDQAKFDEWASSIPSPDTEIIPLGTGSSVPSMLRNVSSTLVRVPGQGSYLLDCGENTLGQLNRAFGDKIEEVLRDLRMIWISHLHADHHLGTAGLLKAWYKAVHNSRPATQPLTAFSLAQSLRQEKGARRLSIISEPAMLRWLAEYSQCDDIGFSHVVPLFNLKKDNSDTTGTNLHIYTHTPDSAQSTAKQNSLVLNQHVDPIPEELLYPLLGLAQFQTCFVPHCHGAQAVALSWPDGLKIAYSGDTRPCLAFARIGQGATVCIHEATFETGMEGEAKAKRHSTTGEAVGIARVMNARACLLTHFSQRYPKIPEIPGMEGVQPRERNEGEDDAARARRLERERDQDRVPDIPVENYGEGEGEGEGGEPEDGDAGAAEVMSEGGASTDSSEAARMASSGAGTDPEVCIAFDFMKFKIRDIPKMRYFYPAFQRLLEETGKELEGAEDGDGEGGRAGAGVGGGDGDGEAKGKAKQKAKAKGQDKGKEKQQQQPRKPKEPRRRPSRSRNVTDQREQSTVSTTSGLGNDGPADS